jgi:pimeloyl-ACP methyl ester carboxylesterase
VTQYTTEIAMDDLDDVRQFLGYSKIDLYGVSYGTRAAMVYVRRHRDHTRAVILDGVAPTDMRLPLYIPRDSQRALDLLFRDCANDIACNQRFPNLKARFNALLVRLDAHPVHARYVDPRTGLEREIDVRRITIARNLLASLYSPLTSATVPLLIDKAEKGDFSGFLAIGTAFDPAWSSMAQGMFFSVVCSEDAPRVTPAALEQEAAGTFLGADMARLRFEPCGFWPRGQVSAGYYANAPSDVPALILSGDLDPVTPPQWGQLVASQWKKSRHIAVPATAHNTAPAGCVMRLISQFLNEGDAASLDASCLQRLKRPPFFVNPSGPEVAK